MANYISENKRKVTTTLLTEMKKQGQRISMLTAYDYTMGTLVDRAGIDVILVVVVPLLAIVRLTWR